MTRARAGRASSARPARPDRPAEAAASARRSPGTHPDRHVDVEVRRTSPPASEPSRRLEPRGRSASRANRVTCARCDLAGRGTNQTAHARRAGRELDAPWGDHPPMPKAPGAAEAPAIARPREVAASRFCEALLRRDRMPSRSEPPRRSRRGRLTGMARGAAAPADSGSASGQSATRARTSRSARELIEVAAVAGLGPRREAGSGFTASGIAAAANRSRSARGQARFRRVRHDVDRDASASAGDVKRRIKPGDYPRADLLALSPSSTSSSPAQGVSWTDPPSQGVVFWKSRNSASRWPRDRDVAESGPTRRLVGLLLRPLVERDRSRPRSGPVEG